MQALAPVSHCLSTVPAASDASGTKDWGRSWLMGNLPRVLRWGGPRFCFVQSWITAGFPKRFWLRNWGVGCEWRCHRTKCQGQTNAGRMEGNVLNEWCFHILESILRPDRTTVPTNYISQSNPIIPRSVFELCEADKVTLLPWTYKKSETATVDLADLNRHPDGWGFEVEQTIALCIMPSSSRSTPRKKTPCAALRVDTPKTQENRPLSEHPFFESRDDYKISTYRLNIYILRYRRYLIISIDCSYV